MKTILSVYGVCDIGLKKPNNEDMILLNDEMFRDGSRQKEFDADKRTVIAIADGIGGLDRGEAASEMALVRLKEVLEKIPDDLNNQELKEVFNVYTQETHNVMSQGMGSTIAGLFVYRNKVFRFHAGDSRIYLLRNGGLRRLTIDHSLKESGGNPDAPSNIITNALGGGNSAFIEFEEIDQPFMNGDIYLLSSDGLHDLVPPDVISDTLMLPDAEEIEATEKLLTLAKDNSGKDNISIITIKVKDKEK
ncbi:MAG: protein phosphatase 2C domain-containing protein [Spirochaetes bacterium]|nr:protein phosphatase 2C domain-containing protein [Brevinematales bacterium]MCL1959492.1 protein phosphatase 2C domain-containing protein [Spirochaetota bacterium]